MQIGVPVSELEIIDQPEAGVYVDEAFPECPGFLIVGCQCWYQIYGQRIDKLRPLGRLAGFDPLMRMRRNRRMTC